CGVVLSLGCVCNRLSVSLLCALVLGLRFQELHAVTFHFGYIYPLALFVFVIPCLDSAVDPDKTSLLNILIDVLCLFAECDTVDKICLLLPILASKRSVDRKIECRHRYVVLTYSKFRVSSQPAY